MDLLKILEKATPWLAAAAAGPAGLAGMALKTIATALGTSDETVSGITAALAGATPEQIQTLKLAELDFKLKMQEMGYRQITEIAAIEAKDRDSARRAAVDGGTATHLFWLSVALLSACIGTEIVVLFKGLPQDVSELVVGRVLGMLDAIALTVLAFNYGTTRGSARKTELLAQADPIK